MFAIGTGHRTIGIITKLTLWPNCLLVLLFAEDIAVNSNSSEHSAVVSVIVMRCFAIIQPALDLRQKQPSLFVFSRKHNRKRRKQHTSALDKK